MSERVYNIWVMDCNRWTNIEELNNSKNPKRMTLEQAKAFWKKYWGHQNIEESKYYIVLEIDKNNNPIIPRCLKIKWGYK